MAAFTHEDGAGGAPVRASSGESSAESERFRDPYFTLGLFAVALVVRLAAAFQLAAEPVWDGQYYDFGAKRIAGGFGYSDDRMIDGHAVWHPWCHYPVGYSAYLGAFYKLFGTSPLVAHFADGLAGALLAVVTFLLAREVLSKGRARFAGVLVALHPGLVLYGALVMTEPLSALLTMAAFWAALRVRRSHLFDGASKRLRPWLVAFRGPAVGALVLGVAALVRPQALLCAPFLALAAKPEASRRIAAYVGATIVACAFALVPVLPWTARNCRVMDGCAIVSTNAGWNLAIGAFPRATGRFETLRSSDGCREVTGQVQQDRCWLEYGLRNIREAPGRWLGLIPAKLGYTFDHESFAVEYLHEARPAAWPEPRRTRTRELLTTFHRGLVVVSALGFVGWLLPGFDTWRRRKRGQDADPATKASTTATVVQTSLLVLVLGAGYLGFSAGTPTFWPIVLIASILPWLPLPGRPRSEAGDAALLMPVALLVTTALAHAAFFGEDRYHVVVTPVFCLLAAAALRRPTRTDA